jgi:hypothetical protein
MYSYQGDTVLDPFVGSGQTTKVAVALERNAVGYDTKQKYTDYAKSRIDEPLRLRPKQLVARFEKRDLHQQGQTDMRYATAPGKVDGEKPSTRRLLDASA